MAQLTYVQVANNATYAFGKTEGNLNVNSALSANNATNAFGKAEGALNVNSALSANNSTYAYGKTEGNLNVNSAVGANQVTGATVNTNASAVLVGANVYINTSAVFVGNASVNVVITQNALKINGGAGNADQVLTSNGSTISWANAPGGANATFLSGNTVTTNASGLLISNSSANLYLTQGALFISGNTGTNGQVLTSNGTTIAWANAAGGSTVYHCKVYKSANQANLTSATVITFDSELNDSSGMHNVSTNTSQIVIPANGIYQVTGQLWLHQPADQGAYTMKAHIYINGAASGAECWSSFRVPTAAVPHMVTWTGYLAAGSYVELYGSAAYASYPRGGNTYTTLEVTSLTLT